LPAVPKEISKLLKEVKNDMLTYLNYSAEQWKEGESDNGTENKSEN